MAVNSSLADKYNELKRVGAKSQVIADAVLRCQYVNQNTASFLSANDVADYIDPRGTAVAFERERSRAVTRLSTLRNFVTLVPLTITWFGFLSISQAKHPDLTTALATLTPVAVFDIFFFAVLIVVGLFADGKASAARRNATSAQQTLDSVVHMLTMQIAQRPTADPGNIKQWAQLVQQQLDAVRDVLKDVSVELKSASATTKDVATQMRALQQATTDLTREAQTLSGAVRGIDASAARMATSAQSVDASSKALTAATAAAAAAQNATTQKMDGVVSDLDTTSKAIDTAAKADAAIPGALSRIDGTLQIATKQLAKTATQIDAVEKRLNSVVRAAGGMHGFGWYLVPWHWGGGRVQVLPPPPIQMPPQWQQPASPPPGQTPPNAQNMPGTPGNPVP